MADGKSGFLQGRSEICEFLCVSRETFDNLVTWGMPARFQQGRWYAHKTTLETWLARWTNVCSSKISSQDEIS